MFKLLDWRVETWALLLLACLLIGGSVGAAAAWQENKVLGPLVALNGVVHLDDFNGYCDYGWQVYHEIRAGCGDRLKGNIPVEEKDG
jgi:hypothetical protein